MEQIFIASNKIKISFPQALERVTLEKDKEAVIVMAEKIQNEVQYPGQIKVNIIRESRACDYAK